MEMTTNDFLQLLLRHGEAFLFLWVLAQQAGLPVPSSPLLLAAGSLASVGRINLASSVALTWCACLIADCLWYLIGRWRGLELLQHLCRTSPEPRSCARRIVAVTHGHGAGVLLFSKFVPGLNFAVPPLAGICGVRLMPFLILDSFASVLWAGSYMSLGYVFGRQFARAAAFSSQLAAIPVVVWMVATAAFIAFKIARRKRSPRSRWRDFVELERQNAAPSQRSGRGFAKELEFRKNTPGGNMKKILRLSAITLLISALATAAFGQAYDPSGRWTATLERGSRSMTCVMNLKLSENQVTGTIDLAPNVTVQIRNGKLENTQLTFDVIAPEHGRTKEIHFVGEVQSEVITLSNESRGKQGRTLIFHRTKD